MNLILLDPLQELERTKALWTGLCAAARPSYFLSWGWIENWLSTLPAAARVRFVVCMEGQVPVLAFFIGVVKAVRHRLLKSRSFALNATGMPQDNDLFAEYNAFLCAPGRHFNLQELLAQLPEEWEEFALPGLDMESFPGNRLSQALPPYNVAVQIDTVCPYVDLERVRQKQGDYLALLSANTRAQIRQSYKRYEQHDKIRLEAAENLSGAMKIFEELHALHQQTWQGRGRQGAFASEYFCAFHRRLIQQRFACGEIQLLRIAAGDKTLGCLYNFVQDGTIYFYQSGINYESDQKLKPGLVAHVEAVRHNVGLGHAIYDFLGDGARYKMSLSTHTRRLLWARIQKPLLKFKIERSLKNLRDAYRKKAPAATAPATHVNRSHEKERIFGAPALS